MRSASALSRRVASLEDRRPVEPIAMSDLDLARRIVFVRVSEGRDLIGEIAPESSLMGRPRASGRPPERSCLPSLGSARAEHLT